MNEAPLHTTSGANLSIDCQGITCGSSSIIPDSFKLVKKLKLLGTETLHDTKFLSFDVVSFLLIRLFIWLSNILNSLHLANTSISKHTLISVIKFIFKCSTFSVNDIIFWQIYGCLLG